MTVNEIIRKYALQNAIFHGGKADKDAILGKLINELPNLRHEIKTILPEIENVLNDINSMTELEQIKELEKIAPELLVKQKKERSTELPALPNSEHGKVVMRLAPYPSGPLHIGNTRMVVLNDEYVKRYDGKLLFIFDDTIGSDKKTIVPEAYDMIKDALDWLDVKYDKIYYKSDRLDIFYEWAEKLIKTGHAYFCTCPSETLRMNRAKGIECNHRKFSVEENLAGWNDMILGKYDDGEAVLRLKTDMNHKNPAFRDRALLRVKKKEHPRTGMKYCVWPLLEFSWAIDDYLLGVTHILRGKDLVIEDEMEKYIWDCLGIKGAEFIHYGMLRIKESKLSKSKSMAEVQSGKFSGWNDPRTWSIQSLIKRGIRPEAVRHFILQFGISLSDIEVPAENLYSDNRKLIDSEAYRYYYVQNPVWIHIYNLPTGIDSVESLRHPDFPEKGKRRLNVGQEIAVSGIDFEKFKGSDVRLKDFCNITLNTNSIFLSREMMDLPKIQWVEKKSGIAITIIMDDGSEATGIGEATIADLKPNEVVQFERFGFVKIDKTDDRITAYFAHR